MSPDLIPPGAGRQELVVVAHPEAGLRAGGARVASVADVDTSSLNLLLDAHGARMQPLFGPSEERLQARTSTREGGPDVPPADNGEALGLTLFYRVVASEDKLDQLANELLAQDLVDGAYVKPPAEPPEGVLEAPAGINQMEAAPADVPPATPGFEGRQGYLTSAPVGVDATFAWTTPGGTGKGVRIIDCEWAWRFTHEDLLENQGGVVAGTSEGNSDHGTAVLGVVSGDRNSFGITGIAPDAVISASSFSDQSSSQAIRAAADKLGAGDIILLEIHRGGPNTPSPEQGQLGYIAIEWWPDDFAAIRYAVNKGIIVVEAAGNGSQDLDEAVYDTLPSGFPAGWSNPFNPANPQSGAVVVGAGSPPPDTHGRDWGPDRSRLDFSNYGRRVDVQGWGREVTTTGYGDLQGGENEDLWYTDQFSGTSSASPVVVGSLAATQGVLRARGHRVLNSDDARRLLRSCGSPQTDAPSRPASQRIGNRPDLRRLIPAAARYRSRSADFDGDGQAEILVTSPSAIGILKQSGSAISASVMAADGTHFGDWLLDTADNHFGPVGDFDGDGRAEILVTSPWGIGILEQSGSAMSASMTAANGTRLDDWWLNTADNSFGPVGDFDGDGRAEILVTSPWGIGILKLSGGALRVVFMAANGTRLDDWWLNTADNSFGPVGDFDGDGRAEILVTSSSGIGILKLSGHALGVVTMAANGTRLDDWLLYTTDNSFGPVGNFDDDGKTEILVTSPWGIGIFKLSGGTLRVVTMAENGTRLGGWLLNTLDNQLGTSADYDGDYRSEILVTSPWGVGILERSGGSLGVVTMAPNGTRFGGWLLNTLDNDVGHGA